MYKAPLNTRTKSVEFQKLELVASYATVNRTTAIPAVYVPPAAAQRPANRERWAKTLETPGGMGAVNQDIKVCERAFEGDRDTTRAAAQRERRAVASQARQAERAPETRSAAAGPVSARRSAVPAQKPMRLGGDPAVGGAPQRAAAPVSGSQRRQPAKDVPARGAPAGPAH